MLSTCPAEIALEAQGTQASSFFPTVSYMVGSSLRGTVAEMAAL